MKYEIAIPSYQRSDQLVEKTLKVLEKHEIDPSIVTIFVANEIEEKIYEPALAKTPYRKIVIGEKGMGAARRFMQTYYDEGTKVVHFDDDLQEILRKVDDKTMVPLENLSMVIERGFTECEKNNAFLWGIYAASNPMFMKHRTAVGLYYCIGSMFGMIHRHDPALSVTMNDKEDFERTLQHYVKDGAVVRLDDITVKTKYYGIGGMQEERTANTITEGAEILEKRYPGLCTMYVRATTGHAELRLRDTRPKVIDDGNSLEDFFS